MSSLTFLESPQRIQQHCTLGYCVENLATRVALLTPLVTHDAWHCACSTPTGSQKKFRQKDLVLENKSLGWGIQKLDFDCKLADNYSFSYSSQTSNNLGLESMNFWAPIVDSSKQLAI